jgi:nucleosome binding factor SPN SPT16 subunit
LSLQAELLSKLRDGTSAKDVYAHAISYIKQKKPELEKHFMKNVGFGVSLFGILHETRSHGKLRWVLNIVIVHTYFRLKTPDRSKPA